VRIERFIVVGLENRITKMGNESRGNFPDNTRGVMYIPITGEDIDNARCDRDMYRFYQNKIQGVRALRNSEGF
jgi:hypothetical protein